MNEEPGSPERANEQQHHPEDFPMTKGDKTIKGAEAHKVKDYKTNELAWYLGWRFSREINIFEFLIVVVAAISLSFLYQQGMS